tara:strand:- start:1640 stop:2056 length:417 start_codon:yes stop_codon:yes gene_type:complete
MIDKIQVKDLLIHKNDKGDLLKGFIKNDNDNFGIEEVYFSEVFFNNIKGWKKHKKMTCNFIVPSGEVEFAILNQDINYSFSITLSRKNYKLLTIPPNYWFAFKGIGKNSNLILNISDIEHSDDEVHELEIDYFKFNWK